MCFTESLSRENSLRKVVEAERHEWNRSSTASCSRLTWYRWSLNWCFFFSESLLSVWLISGRRYVAAARLSVWEYISLWLGSGLCSEPNSSVQRLEFSPPGFVSKDRDTPNGRHLTPTMALLSEDKCTFCSCTTRQPENVSTVIKTKPNSVFVLLLLELADRIKMEHGLFVVEEVRRKQNQ